MADDRLLDQVIELAHRVGATGEYCRAGGGNISAKTADRLLIKPSGVAMAGLRAEDLVALRLDVLRDCLNQDQPVAGDPVLAAARAARVGPDDGRRPSVELLFHALIPDPLVLHAHPLTINALTCNADGPELAARLLGDRAVFVPYTDPGLPLARAIAARRAAFSDRTGEAPPPITLLGNHGVIVAGDSAAAVWRLLEDLTQVVAAEIAARTAVARTTGPTTVAPSAATPTPTFRPPASLSPPPGAPSDTLVVPSVPSTASSATVAATSSIASLALDPARVVLAVAPLLRGLLGSLSQLALVAADTSDDLRADSLGPGGQALLRGPSIPDQIVYAGSLPVVIDPGAPDLGAATIAAVAAFRQVHGHDPVVALLPGVAALAAGESLAAARNALATFRDALQVARRAEAIGAYRALDDRERAFIEQWEAESYRRATAASPSQGRLAGKVVLITGAAQGLGLGLAQELIGQGATVVLADLNLELARAEAEALGRRHGAGRALAVAVDVADEASVQAAVTQVVGLVGGLDVFVSNAGVLRAGGVFDQTTADFDLVTAVNYRGYFLGVRAVAPVLAAQRRVRPDDWFDIIEINSKSGLTGSKRNFAYAGSKFGGIGLTQSFALELVACGIKVNAICPGNYLDGPLWTDPERGLLVQYLRAGKVPGATSVAQVRAFYEAQTPMGRGVRPADLAKAVYYIVEQDYETGQAVPVTGGQTMLN
ncbi:MAG: SDR family NAD(P)-dependent oxidoreductase [Propionibacteriaceae bacterium]|nr:SDR family NAD(P)-dependent oxidoreductase [Propionibacteriaceae bacterium]